MQTPHHGLQHGTAAAAATSIIKQSPQFARTLRAASGRTRHFSDVTHANCVCMCVCFCATKCGSFGGSVRGHAEVAFGVCAYYSLLCRVLVRFARYVQCTTVLPDASRPSTVHDSLSLSLSLWRRVTPVRASQHTGVIMPQRALVVHRSVDVFATCTVRNWSTTERDDDPITLSHKINTHTHSSAHHIWLVNSIVYRTHPCAVSRLHLAGRASIGSGRSVGSGLWPAHACSFHMIC